MLWAIFAQLYATLIELLCLSRLSTDEKDLEILVVRQQLDVMKRKNNQVVRPSKVEKWSLAVPAAALKKRGRLTTSQLGRVIRIFKPETVSGCIGNWCDASGNRSLLKLAADPRSVKS